ncbi:MAG: RNA-binding protein [Saprospiraceae bacterium]|nr:RNA-binding protein [Saprospiraceae bacterium]
MTIFVAKLPASVNGVVLESLFARFGEVDSAKVIYDRHTGESKKFGFVEMPNDDEARKAIEALNEYELEGKVLVVKEAEPPSKKFRIRM